MLGLQTPQQAVLQIVDPTKTEGNGDRSHRARDRRIDGPGSSQNDPATTDPPIRAAFVLQCTGRGFSQ